jgi:transcriptional regulator with XRE-family HTH domain
MEARDFVIDLQSWGLTQAQIAERTGIPQPTVSKIFRGDVEDVLSRNYRSLQTVHAEELAKRPAADAAAPPQHARQA